MKATEQA